MGARLVVDGHNVIFRSAKLAETYGRDAQGTRARFVRQLAEFGARKHYQVTVVFDSGKGGTGIRSSEDGGTVSILYARAGETADDLIAEILPGMRSGDPTFVASSDRGVQQIARSARAEVWTAEKLLEKIVGEAPKRRPADWHPVEHGLKGYTGEDD